MMCSKTGLYFIPRRRKRMSYLRDLPGKNFTLKISDIFEKFLRKKIGHF
jgi:hypothetical protein